MTIGTMFRLAGLAAGLALACAAADAQVSRDKILGQKGAAGAIAQKPTQPELPKNLGGGPILSPKPVQLHSTLDLQECGKHGGVGGGVACQALLAKGQLVLVWDWSGSEKIDGYRVYRTDGGKHEAVGVQQSGKDITMYVVPPAGGYDGKCFSVVAFAGAKESLVSNAYCTSGGATLQSISLSAAQTRVAAREKHQQPQGLFKHTPLDEDDKAPKGIHVGYQFFTQKDTVKDGWWNGWDETALLYDLAGVAGKKIWSAKLHLTVTVAAIGTVTDARDHLTSCATRIGYGRDRWWQHNDWVDSAVTLTPGEITGPDVSIDVTAMVKAWAGGQPNFGLVLMGDDLPGGFVDKQCETIFAYEPKLEIQYAN